MPDQWDGRERRGSMPEIAALQESLDQVREQIKEQNTLTAAQNLALGAQTKKLTEVENKLPGFVNRRGFLLTVVALTLAGLAVIGSVLAIRSSAQENRRTDRMTSAARAYANCNAINRAFHGVDIGYTALAAQALANAQDDTARERVRESLRRLRSGLQRTDCDGHLSTLSPDDAETVRAEASRTLPTLPLPPPPTS